MKTKHTPPPWNHDALLAAAKAAHKWAMLKNNMDVIPWLEDIEAAITEAEGK